KFKLDGGVNLYDAFFDVLLAPPLSPVTIRGTEADFAPANGQILSLPSLPVFTPGSETVFVAEGSFRRLDAGSYGTVVGGYGAAVELSGGLYQMLALKVQNGAAVRAAAPVVVNVAKKLLTGERVFIGPAAASGIGESQIRFNVGAKSIVYGRKASLVGRFFSP